MTITIEVKKRTEPDRELIRELKEAINCVFNDYGSQYEATTITFPKQTSKKGKK